MLKSFLKVAAICLILSGCYFSNDGIRLINRDTLFGTPPSMVRVEKGDTLYSISRRYSIPLKDLIQVNSLHPPYTLKVGQSLHLPSTQYHIVKKGDTLYSISRQYNVDLTSLSRVNNLQPPYTLHIGQKLLLSGTISGNSRSYQAAQDRKASSSSASKSKMTQTAGKKQASKKVSSTPYTPPKNRTAKFLWPVKGTVVSNFGVIGKGRKNDGINIKAARGTDVKAADKGTVAYAGNELKGFGNLILIKHTDGWITAYAHNDKLLVKKGQKVIKGEKIATVGSTGSVDSPQLHFEIRAGKKAVDPRKYLP